MNSFALCPKCQLDHLIEDPESGEQVCSICGIVFQEKMEETKIRLHSKDPNSRGIESCSLADYDMTLSTIIGYARRDAKGQEIQPSVHSAIKRLRIWNYRVQQHSGKDTSLKRAFDTLDILRDKLRLSDAAIEKAAYIYRKAQKKGLVKGRSIESVIIGAVYIAMEETLSNVSLKEISKVCNIHPTMLGRMVILLSTKLEIMVPLPDPIRCVTKVGNILGLSEKTKRHAIKIMDRIREGGYSDGKKSMTLAATAIYTACSQCGEQKSQKEIAKAANITDVILRIRLSDLKARSLIW